MELTSGTGRLWLRSHRRHFPIAWRHFNVSQARAGVSIDSAAVVCRAHGQLESLRGKGELHQSQGQG